MEEKAHSPYSVNFKHSKLFISSFYFSVYYRFQHLHPPRHPLGPVRSPWPRWPAPSGGGSPAVGPYAAAPPGWLPAADDRTKCSCFWLSAPQSSGTPTHSRCRRSAAVPPLTGLQEHFSKTCARFEQQSFPNSIAVFSWPHEEFTVRLIVVISFPCVQLLLLLSNYWFLPRLAATSSSEIQMGL